MKLWKNKYIFIKINLLSDHQEILTSFSNLAISVNPLLKVILPYP